MSTVPLITIFVRHGADCKYKGDEFEKRCRCRKHLRWTANGKQHRHKADTRAWAEAEQVKRNLEDELAGRVPVQAKTGQLIEEAVKVFIQDKTVQGVSIGVIGKYTLELERFQNYCERESVFTVQSVTRELLTGYCATWPHFYPSSCTRSKVRERLRSFLRYCYECKWLERVPATPKIKIDEPPTMPLVGDEYPRLLDALYVVNPKRWDGKQSTQGLSENMRVRIRSLIQIMRWSGLAIRDAVSLPKTSLAWEDARQTYRVTTSRQKTGTHVASYCHPMFQWN